MADRLSQLQDAVNVQAENLCNSIGLLQQCARPSLFPEFGSFNRTASRSYQQVLLEAGIPGAVVAGVTGESPDKQKNNKTKSTDADDPAEIPATDTKPMETNGQVPGPEPPPPVPIPLDPEENTKLFAKLITKTAKDIDQIIESLPSRDMEPDLQEAHVSRLEEENLDDTVQLELAISQGERLLDVIKEALQDIVQNQMMMRQSEMQMLTGNHHHNNNLLLYCHLQHDNNGGGGGGGSGSDETSNTGTMMFANATGTTNSDNSIDLT